jgi:hypothetical protein
MRSMMDTQGEAMDKGDWDHRPAPWDAGELLMAHAMKRHFAGGKHLKFAEDGRFWFYEGKRWIVVENRWIEGRLLDCLNNGRV